jgi:hypothetical protein
MIVANHEYSRPATVKVTYSMINDNDYEEDYYGIDDDKVKLPLCLINEASRHEDVEGEWRYSSTILDLGTG